MKEVVAIIRMNKINDTKRALTAAGISSMHANECLGRGKGVVDFKMLAGAEKGYEEAIAQLGQSQRLVPKRMISMVVPDKLVSRAVRTVIDANKTGKSGDGKIFVLPVSEALRVRTGEEGDSVLDEV
ncbi:MAG: P-II family nitrogen regulator [Chitinispirillaceae bacterium]|jgi:nitrogen regulatory protein PII 2|nr:P-II family nitrogen regulator [Chitinispirillaceae bacterium]